MNATFRIFLMAMFALLHAAVIQTNARPGGLMLRSPEFAPEGFFRFYFTSSNGQPYNIEVSTDFVNWASLTNVVGSGGNLWIEDRSSATFNHRFYHIGVRPTPITNMVFIPPGSFTMGSPQNEPGRDANEGPQTTVTISKGFWICKYEVDQTDYVTLVGSNTSVVLGWQLPVDFASWAQATNYIQKLNDRERAAGRLPAGYAYRLPTEAEWEYACRAGTSTAVALGTGTSLSSTQANFDGNFPYAGAPKGPDRRSTTVPGTFAPNAWGLYDMHGNVAEWCQDVFAPYPGGSVRDPKGPETGTTRVIRGGGYISVGNACRSSKRDGRSQTLRNFNQGIRVVLSAE